MLKHVWLLLGILCLPLVIFSQVQSPYILNGSATQRTCNCYVLTEDVGNASGTVWNKNLINLNNSFDYYFDVNLGCKDATGADGIGFILQTQGTNLGATGQGLGFKGISPSVGILIDTWQNQNENDPAYDHVSIQINGVTDHSNSATNLAGPVTALDGSDNIEDCNWHIFRIQWDATLQQLTVSMDGIVRLSAVKNLIDEVFNSNPNVYWGFAGATGGSSNKQQFCAALRPVLDFKDDQVFCIGTPILFSDSSKSFGTVTRWLWDFGDGITTTVSQPGTHLYAAAGIYDVTLVIEDNSGCVSDTVHQSLTVGSYPVAGISTDPLCQGRPLLLKDASTVDVGTIDQWQWDYPGGTATTQNTTATFSSTGDYDVQLKVTTAEGCSDATTQTVHVYETPSISASGEDVCIGEPIDFTGTDLSPTIPLAGWHWNLDNGQLRTGQNITYTYPAGGKYNATLFAISTNGCASDTVTVPVSVIDIQLDAGRDTLIAKGQPLQLHATATGDDLSYSWAPSTGLDNPFIANPLALLQDDQIYIITVISPQGCRMKDTLNVKAYTGPEFYVPTAFSPNHDGQNDLFRAIAAGVPQLDFFCVWDRWGHEMWRTASLSGSWDGTFKGQEAPVGTYVWMIQGTDYTGRKFNRKGTVTIVR